MSSKAQTLQVNHLLKDGCVSITSFCKAKKNGAPQVNWENFWTCLFLGRRFWSFDLFWRLAFSIGGICCILSRVAVHIKAVCIRMNSRKVCKSSLQAFSVTCDFFDEPGNLPLIKKSWVFVYFTLYTLSNHWTLIPNFSEFFSTLSFRRYTPCAGFESTWLTTTTGLRTGCRSRFSWIGRRSSVAGVGPFPLPLLLLQRLVPNKKNIYQGWFGVRTVFWTSSKLWKSGPVMFFLVDCLSLELHGFGCFFYPLKTRS